jgi:hypothetical protein
MLIKLSSWLVRVSKQLHEDVIAVFMLALVRTQVVASSRAYRVARPSTAVPVGEYHLLGVCWIVRVAHRWC